MNFKDAEEEETIKDKGIYLRSVFTYSYLCYVTLLKLDLKVLQKQFSFIKMLLYQPCMRGLVKCSLGY